MAFMTVESQTLKLDIVVFPDKLKKYFDHLFLDSLVIIKGKVSFRNDEVGILLDECSPLNEETLENDSIYKASEKNGTRLNEPKVTYSKTETKIKKESPHPSQETRQVPPPVISLNIDHLDKNKLLELKNYLTKLPNGKTEVRLKINEKIIGTDIKITPDEDIKQRVQAIGGKI